MNGVLKVTVMFLRCTCLDDSVLWRTAGHIKGGGAVQQQVSDLLANFHFSTTLKRILPSLAPGEPPSASLYLSLCGGDSNEWYPWQQVSMGRSPERRRVRK